LEEHQALQVSKYQCALHPTLPAFEHLTTPASGGPSSLPHSMLVKNHHQNHQIKKRPPVGNILLQMTPAN
jgi:hypothetical protein